MLDVLKIVKSNSCIQHSNSISPKYLSNIYLEHQLKVFKQIEFKLKHFSMLGQLAKRQLNQSEIT